ncbi:hypothetical protein F0562_032398 [Nyssa sinensis]|uniref:UvrD-like helicase ATP-binding domain-containing protein n=1 Tax=Nyssa sinensis TaxID=561372 RepID=A0A5J5ASI0_9ASTE|nr:hypothetical protein F0562_032398 [Nyssa sinensis]
MMTEKGPSISDKKRPAGLRHSGLIDLVFSWSLEDIFNENLYKNRVEKIPGSFQSVEHYLDSYVYPLLEETRADLASSMEIIYSAPFSEVIFLNESDETLLYDIKVDYWRNRFSDRGKEPYCILPGDIIILSDVKPVTVSDLQQVGRTWTFASVTHITKDENEVDTEDENEVTTFASTCFKVKASKDIGVKEGMFVVFLINIITNRRIWNSLHMFTNLRIIKKVLCTNSVVEEDCDICSVQSNSQLAERFGMSLLYKLNESQTKAILASLLKMKCNHKSFVELIWGPPGTGKTKIVSVMLFNLLRVNYRILTCAPTNVAITEVASQLIKLVKESFKAESTSDVLFCYLGDILLFGNKDRLKVGSEIEEIYLDYRIERLAECLGPLTGWRHCLTSMIDFLEDCVSEYHIFVENELIKSKECCDKDEFREMEFKSFLEFARARFESIASALRRCLSIFCTHLPKHFLLEHNFQNMVSLVCLLDSLKKLLFQDNVVSEELEELLSLQEIVEEPSESFVDMPLLLCLWRSKCPSVLKTLRHSLEELDLPTAFSGNETAELVNYCEAAQLKECESVIPLQLRGMRHAILIGDERQLPARVNSKVSDEAGFGRSLFDRLSSLGHSKHLLNIQYRMHPSISFFPNSNFYHNQILDAPNVKNQNYERHYLPGPMFGPYSFINIVGGREERDDVGHSRRNMVEVAVVLKIVKNLYKAWNGSKIKLSIGVVSPYAAQVMAIQDKLGKKFENNGGFVVKVKSIDGCQGGEEDVIILSTVRINNGGFIGFVSSPQRTNVALTRARHCLWILGNERTLANSGSVWEAIVRDAKDRHCFFNADEDTAIAKAILDVKKELDQLDDLLTGNSVLFKTARWKFGLLVFGFILKDVFVAGSPQVLFSDNFKKSFQKLMSIRTKKSVLNLLLKLSTGWRPKKRNVDSVCESSSQALKQFKVERLFLVCTIDIVKDFGYIQVLKVWDILPLEEIPKLVKRLDGIFATYTDDFINHCKEKFLNGDLEVPQRWVTSYDIVRFKNISNNEFGSDSNANVVDGRSYVENSKVSESLLLMKFYSLSSGVVRHLLSDRDGRELDLPFELIDQEKEIILCNRSTFILGRSGTGKTTVLTMKLFQKEQQHHMAYEGLFAVESGTTTGASQRNEVGECIGKTKGTVLRQLFVTVSPKLCYAVKQHVSQLKSFACGECSAENSSIDMDDMDDKAKFKDIPDSFVDIPPNKYPLIITFHKFLMMLDGTLGNSYFKRFHDVRKLSDGKTRSSRSVALQTFIRTKEVNYDRFCSFYWPHFNTQLTKKLDSSRVFTEIISHIKGGLQAGEACDGKLSREDYVLLSEGRVSSLNKQKRERIYDIFQDYEKIKMKNGEFDLADLVIDLHHRLCYERFEVDEMDFVYIDEVQDLTMRQIALFKYICRNVDEGFVFSGDTAQTIARGIDFRFQDIRSLFYKKFVLESRSDGSAGRNEKGQISEIFNLSQNFRTHAGVLKLAQSVIELLYCFFPQSVDVLKPETSLIYGEAPILLASLTDENVIVTIFGDSGNVGGNIVGFGAEQVILVRDDCARMEISDYVGKQALVLTIVECKGLEFQDVLLYNFFGSSPLKNQWRVIYEFMKEQDLLDATSPKSFPHFDQARHHVMCSELKQLYVAITRTRQRLWICENIEEPSRPMFDYWKKKCLVQVKKLDYLLAQAMQVASSPEEWKARGIKLFWENNYEMATMCFERAGDTMWEKRAKASGLKAAAGRMHASNPEMAFTVLKEAAEIFDSIGRAESAAECFCDLGEYKRAGRIYLGKCGESELKKAGECFSLAGCYKLAAEAYAKGNYFSECLSVCTKGKLFDMGLQYVGYWKQHAPRDNGMATRSNDIEKIEQEFLETCALNFYEVKDKRSMMKFVKAFHSMALRRNFLKSLDCLDELLLLEEELGNFLEAAEIAKLRGDLLLEADLLGKAGHFNEASLLILWYVFSNSLWVSGSTGWPLKQFTQKDELLSKAKLFAKKVSDIFYESVCTEVNILSNEQTNLLDLKQYFNASQRHKSLRGEILSVRKILDAHLHSNTSNYEWETELVVDMIKHSEDIISQNRVSVETLFYFWNLWKENILKIFEYLECLETQDVNKYLNYSEFCLNYFGIWRQFSNLNIIYILLNSDADWVRDVDDRFLRRSKKLGFTEARQFVPAARSHWRAELLSVGMKVLKTFEALYKISTMNSLSLFCQSICLIHLFEVAKFFMESKFLDCKFNDTRMLQNFLKLSTGYLQIVFPLDWRESLTESMISLRGTEFSRKLLEEVIRGNLKVKGELTYGQIGRVVMVLLGSGKPTNELYKEIVKRFDGTLSWRAFVENLSGNVEPEFSQRSPLSNFGEAPKVVSLVYSFDEALEDTYNANWRTYDYISPSCFLYLVDRLLILVSYFQGLFFTTKSSFVEWLFYPESYDNPCASFVTEMQSSPGGIFDNVAHIVQQLLYNKQDTVEWIGKSNFNYCYPLLVLRLVVILCLLCVNSGKYFDVLFGLLRRGDITSQLPREFLDVLRRNDVKINASMLAEAFKNIGDPLVIVSLGKNCSKYLCPDAICVDMEATQCREDIMKVLFPRNIKAPESQDVTVELNTTNSFGVGLTENSSNQGNCSTAQSSNFASKADQNISTKNWDEGNLKMNWGLFWEISDTLQSLEINKLGNLMSFMPTASKLKVEVVKNINVLTAALSHFFRKKPCDGEDGNIFGEANSMLDELKQLYSALDVSDKKLKKNLSTIGELLMRLQLREARLETFLNQLFEDNNKNDTSEASDSSIVSETQYDMGADNSNAEDTSNSGDGKMKAVATETQSKGSESRKVKGNSKFKKGKRRKGRKK